MLAVASKPSAAGSSPSRPLPLESGEFMHSREFLRRYQRLPQVKKAELIEGVVYMGSPVSVRHAKPDALIQGWLVAEARLEWFCLEDDDYRPQLPDAQGVLHSRVFPGLRLPVAPLLAGDTAKVLAALTGHEPLNRKPPETSVNSED
jgi:hypothetical protein